MGGVASPISPSALSSSLSLPPALPASLGVPASPAALRASFPVALPSSPSLQPQVAHGASGGIPWPGRAALPAQRAVSPPPKGVPAALPIQRSPQFSAQPAQRSGSPAPSLGARVPSAVTS